MLGGWLIDGVGWRAIFLLNLPLAIGAIVLALIYVKDEPDKEQKTALDVGGAALATLALGRAGLGLDHRFGPAGVDGVLALGLAGAAVVLLAVFVAVEARLGERAIDAVGAVRIEQLHRAERGSPSCFTAPLAAFWCCCPMS